MNKLLVSIAFATTVVSTQAAGQSGGVPREVTRAQARQFADMMFQRFDLNHDGVITRDEAEQARAQLSQGRAVKAGAKAEKMIDRIFGTAQSVTQSQFEAMALAKFDRQDLNHDGVVTPDERHQATAASKRRRSRSSTHAFLRREGEPSWPGKE